VFDGDNVPMPDAMIELWQADANGEYDSAESMKDSERFCGFGRGATNDAGVCTFETIKPGRVPGPGGTLQAPHLNVSVFGRGLLNRLATRIYFAGDSANMQDSVLALVPEDRRSTLFCHQDAVHPESWSFEIHLCGESETVFFDV
jgi:protocatechuate 3,4-dioxygenase alpha subunit